jgi:thioredoxin 1
MGAEQIVRLTDINFPEEVLKSPIPVLVDFFAEWCGPCKAIAPVLDEFAVQYDGKIKIGKVDIDQAQGLAVQYRIQKVPTLLVFQHGQVQQEIEGFRSRRDLQAKLEALLEKSPT